MDDIKEALIDYYRNEVRKLEQLTEALKAFGIKESEFDPNLNLNKFKREMVKFIEALD